MNNTTKQNIISKYYFQTIFKSILSLASTYKSTTRGHKQKINVLDYGCGLSYFKKYVHELNLMHFNVFGYDLKKEVTEITKNDVFSLHFDIVILCQVACYMEREELILLLNKLRNKRAVFIFVISTESYLSKLFAFFLGHFKPHSGFKMHYNEQKDLIEKLIDIKQKRKIYFASEIICGKLL